MIGRRGLVGAALAALTGRGRKPVSGSWSNTGQTLIVVQETVTGFSGIFGYSPVVGHGNLVFSVSAAAGTDPYGNHYAAGITTYNESSSVFANLFNGFLALGLITGSGPDIGHAGAIRDLGLGQMTIASSVVGAGAQADALVAFLSSGAAGQPTGSATAPNLKLRDLAGTSAVDAYLSGTVIKTDLSGTPLTWQTPGFNAGYSASVLAQYRLDGLDNVVWDISVSQATGVVGAGAAVITTAVPAQYRPVTHNRPIPCAWTSSAQVSKGAATMRFNTDGTISLMWPSTTANGDIFSVTVSIPLGNVS